MLYFIDSPSRVDNIKELLLRHDYISWDSETSSLNPHDGYLISTQFGVGDDQIVIDNRVVSPLLFKDIYESKSITLVGWNLQFDISWLFKYGIIPENICDCMIIEQLLYLGIDTRNNDTGIASPIAVDYDKVWSANDYAMYEYSLAHPFTLKTAVWKYLGVILDKSIRGSIATEGLTERVIRYAADDVAYLDIIRKKQADALRLSDLCRAAIFENACVVPMAYLAYCGVGVDTGRWLSHSDTVSDALKDIVETLRDDVLTFYLAHKSSDGYIDDHIPFGRYEGKRYIPFICRNLQGDLFSGYDTDEHVADINFSSSQQVIPLLSLMGVDCRIFDKKRREERESYNSAVLLSHSERFPILRHLLTYKDLSKQLTSFGPSFVRTINKRTGRLYAGWRQLGTRTGRISSSGPNMQQLPSDAHIRGCFIAGKGNKWISADYRSQESRLIASISNDQACIDLFTTGCGDMHSLVAKMAYPEIIGDCPVEDIKKKFGEQRQEAKKIEFAINYAGDAHTIANNMNMSLERATEIYNNYMSGLTGIASYQRRCKEEIVKTGIVLINPITGHRALWGDWRQCKEAMSYISHNDYEGLRRFNRACHIIRVKDKNDIIEEVWLKNIMDYANIKMVKKKVGDWKKRCVNFRIQGTGALCLKNALRLFWNYVKESRLVGVVLFCAVVHDEFDIEAPADIADTVAAKLMECMKRGAAPFCTRVPMEADMTINYFWEH